MPYKPEHKQKTRRRIVEGASRQFRAHGFEGVGIAALMGSLNLTHGGFYAHFTNKEQLITEACQAALSESLEQMLAVLDTGGFPALLDFYLSEKHRDNPTKGCPLPALVTEITRQPHEVREAFTQQLSHVFHAVGERMPGNASANKEAKVMALFSAMAGAVALARTVSDSTLSEALLSSTRKHLQSLFEDGG